MKNNLLVVFGSGASFASGYRHKKLNLPPPIDQNFFSKMSQNVFDGFPAIKMIRNANRFQELRSLEENFSLGDCAYKIEIHHPKDTKNRMIGFVKKLKFYGIDEYRNYFRDLNQQYVNAGLRHKDIKMSDSREHLFTGDLGREFRILISEIYKSSNYNCEEDNYQRLLELINGYLIGCVNFNYDLFAEKALARVSRDTKILKYFHGCLRWKHSKGEPVSESTGGEEIEPNYKDTEKWIQPGIVAPAYVKEQLEKPIPGDKMHKRLKHEHEEIKCYLPKIKRVLFIGYSFPDSDNYARDFWTKNVFVKKIKVGICNKPFDESEIPSKKKEYQKKLSLSTEPEVYPCGFNKLVNPGAGNTFLENFLEK